MVVVVERVTETGVSIDTFVVADLLVLDFLAVCFFLCARRRLIRDEANPKIVEKEKQ